MANQEKKKKKKDEHLYTIPQILSVEMHYNFRNDLKISISQLWWTWITENSTTGDHLQFCVVCGRLRASGIFNFGNF